MKAFDATLQSIMNSPNQYVIPVFQRYYSWGRDEWSQLWEDVVDLSDPDLPSRNHFMGSLVFVPEQHFPNIVPAYQVIDGQQRVVTLSLLLCALRGVARKKEFSGLADEIQQTFLVHPFKRGREHYRVYPRQRDREQYMKAVDESIIPIGSIGEAIAFFAEKINGLSQAETETGLRALFELLQSRFEFVHITLEGENPYRIFKSLNSTGVDLSEGDLIRNFVFMHVQVDMQDEFDDLHWKPLEAHFEDPTGKLNSIVLSGFFRDYLMQKGMKYVPPKSTFQTFEETFGGDSFDPIELTKDLIEHVGFYDILRGILPHPDNAAENALYKLRQLESSTTYPLILKLAELVRKAKLSQKDFVTAVELVSGFIMRRYICGESSRAYSRWFVSACGELGNQPLQNLTKFLNSKGFPNDARFKSQLGRYALYGSRYARSVLEALEYAIPHKERADLSFTEIEHIMPQTLSPEWKIDLGADFERVHAEWLHTIGNLTLSAYNGPLWNKPFFEKKEYYKDSNVLLTRQLANYANWGETEILNRGQRLADIAANIWISPPP